MTDYPGEYYGYDPKRDGDTTAPIDPQTLAGKLFGNIPLAPYAGDEPQTDEKARSDSQPDGTRRFMLGSEVKDPDAIYGRTPPASYEGSKLGSESLLKYIKRGRIANPLDRIVHGGEVIKTSDPDADGVDQKDLGKEAVEVSYPEHAEPAVVTEEERYEDNSPVSNQQNKPTAGNDKSNKKVLPDTTTNDERKLVAAGKATGRAAIKTGKLAVAGVVVGTKKHASLFAKFQHYGDEALVEKMIQIGQKPETFSSSLLLEHSSRTAQFLASMVMPPVAIADSFVGDTSTFSKLGLLFSAYTWGQIAIESWRDKKATYISPSRQ